MKTVNIGELKDQLSSYLLYVRGGEEVVVRRRNLPIARILPIQNGAMNKGESRMVAAGEMTLPKRRIDWDEFFAIPTGSVSDEASLEAVLEGRGDR
jgi:antitoxin (DNA-binding transcriptional repressor) of toxin-antitoxin stability system